jgi:hypothetical protein
VTPEALRQVQDLAQQVKSTCAIVTLVCEGNDVDYRGARLNEDVVHRMIHAYLDLAQELEADGADPDHVAAVLALIDELEVAEEMLRVKVLALARLEGRA